MRDSWRPRPGDRVVRHPRQDEISPVRLTVSPRKVPSRALASPLILAYLFVALITVGTLLLLLPNMRAGCGLFEEGLFGGAGCGFTPFMDAFFTATSAATVTGLVVEETSTYWSRDGQTVIVALMFVGGLGFMTSATFLLVLIGQRVTLAQRLLVKESLGVDQLGGLVRLAVGIVLVASFVQLAGAVALFIRFSFLYSPAEATWQAVFHAVSAFNNAGFVVLREPGGVGHFQGDEATLVTMGLLIVLGSISYLVMIDVVRYRKFSEFTLNTKLVLLMTLAMLMIGAVVFLASEYQNAASLGPLPLGSKLMVSAFETVSGRTAGFTTVDYSLTEPTTNFFFTSLMFIGGASASVAGGIKVNTLAVALVAMLSTVRGRVNASAFGREIPQAQVRRAMAVGGLAIAFAFALVLMLTSVEEGFDFLDLFFEAISAFGTVGLSTGLTGDLSFQGQLILILGMFVGRIGPLTLALGMARRAEGDMYRYARERVTIG